MCDSLLMECKKCKEPYKHEAIGAGRQESVHLLPASQIWLWMAVHFIPANLKYEEHTLSLWESTEDLKGQHPKTLYAGHHNNTKVCEQQEKHGNSHAQKIWIQVNELVINIEEGKRNKLLNKGLTVYASQIFPEANFAREKWFMWTYSWQRVQ